MRVEGFDGFNQNGNHADIVDGFVAIGSGHDEFGEDLMSRGDLTDAQWEQRQKKGQKGGHPVVLVVSDYAKRNVVERCILRLRQWRRVETRYEKRESNYLAMATLAAIILWLR